MYRLLRVVHRWVGVVGSLFLLTLSVTGFLLATKGSFGWVRPPEMSGTDMTSLAEAVGIHEAAEAAFSVGIAELRDTKDIDRIDYRPKSNVYKVVSKEGYHEVQVDGATGRVLQVARRVDQLSEDIHDLSFVHDAAHTYWLPVVSLLLFYLSASGIVMFCTPLFRRFRHRSALRKARGGR
jgi:uncharacterized iron-regulated membrane protein